jgi:glycosyltransferase involved in cell wall biosynthesis
MNVLFVSLAFPPKNDPECIQAGRYFKYLSKDVDMKIDVVTSSAPTLFMPVDEGLKKYDLGYRQKVEIRLFESKLLSFVLRKAGLHGLLFPDSKMTFHWQWRTAVDQLTTKPDIIYSRSNPMSSAMMAMKLKRHFNVPWVMHMSDPWAISPLGDMPDAVKEKSLSTEEEFLRLADRVTVTSSQTLDFYAARYPKYAAKFAVFPNVYDPDDVRDVKMGDSGKLRIVYTGGLTGKRNVLFMDQVLKAATLLDPERVEDVEFVFAGDMDRANRAFFRRAHPCIRHMGIVSHSEARALCESAHILMVVDNPSNSEEAIFFPSKLLDYFLAKRKIWAVTPVKSVTRDVLQDANHVAFHHSEIGAMAAFLLDSVRRFKSGEFSRDPSIAIPKKFSAETNAQLLSILLKQVSAETHLLS